MRLTIEIIAAILLLICVTGSSAAFAGATLAAKNELRTS